MDNDNFIIADDKLRGAAAIAEFLGESERRVRWLIRTRRIPFGKQGGDGHIIASKRALRRHYLAATDSLAGVEMKA